MDVAKAMVLGGKVLHADECDYYSYSKLGLRCLVCGEPVHLRKGSKRKSYFAHFKGTTRKQVEECKLRASIYANNVQSFDNKLIEDKGQRLKIFQQNFLNLIAINDSSFHNKIHTVKDVFGIKSEIVIKECTKIFIGKSEKYKIKLDKIIINSYDKKLSLQKQISYEAIDYLCIKSSFYLIKQLICYSIFNCYQSNSLPWSSFTVKSKYPDICHRLMEIIINNPWLESFSKITVTYNKKLRKEIVTDKRILRKAEQMKSSVDRKVIDLSDKT